MAELFFSYSSKDRERVRPIYEALKALGFDVFWDQQVPAGWDWDTWIRQQLADARCVVVFWSLSSVASPNVRHETTIADEQKKLVPIMLDPLTVGQFPIGLFNTQAARLMEWSGDGDDPEWRKLVSEVERNVMPAWAARRIARLDAELKAEAKRREAAQAKEDAAEAQLEQEIVKHGQLRREREQAQAETQIARAELSGIKHALQAAKAQNSDLAERLASAEQQAAKTETMLAEEIARQDDLRRDRDRAQAETERARAELLGTKGVLDAVSASRLLRSGPRKLSRAAASIVGVMLAFGGGASIAFIVQESVWTKRAALAAPPRAVTFFGNVILPNPTVRTAEGCRDACVSNSRCKGYEYRGGSNICWNYSAIKEESPSDLSTSARWD